MIKVLSPCYVSALMRTDRSHRRRPMDAFGRASPLEVNISDHRLYSSLPPAAPATHSTSLVSKGTFNS